MSSIDSGLTTEEYLVKSDKKSSDVDPQFILSLNTPVVELDVSTAFEGLTNQEKLYAHYISKASWYGGLICLVQSSPEAPLIFSLVLKVFGGQPVSQLESLAVENGLSQEDFKALLVYTAGVLTNSSNYKSFGDTKFVPTVTPDKFETVIKLSSAYKESPQEIEHLWQRVRHPIYSLTDKEKTLGFPDKAITTYLSINCCEEDTILINKYLRSRGFEAYNTRAIKTVKPDGSPHYEIRLASQDVGDDPSITRDDDVFEGATFSVTRGDYSALMGIVSDYLEKAKVYAANETEQHMLTEYVKSFRTGSLNAHKVGSRYWIKDKGPVIETYIGFIETYRDPAGERGEFCGWVAVVNKDRSAKFSALVSSAEVLLPELPWPRAFEKDTFLQPDFTSLDVLTFACSGVPSGINIPNYDEIRQNEGYKNVSLGNVISSSVKDDTISFVTPEDQDLINKYKIKAFELHVGLHELLGHGSGKLFRRDENGKFNFDIDNLINPLTGNKIDKWYEKNETYDSKFTTISSSYEECRAEVVGLYLSLHPLVLKIFGYEGKEAEDITYVNWLTMVCKLVANGPEAYSPEKKAWLQAHTQARFVILRVLLEAGEGFVKFVETEPGQDMLVTLDRTKLYTVGKQAIGNFLLKLQVYKSLGDIAEAQKLYKKYSEVPEEGSPWVNWRSIALAHIKPRRMFVQPNTNVVNEEVVLKRYEPTLQGVIESWKERFDNTPNIHDILEKLWKKDQPYFQC